MTDATRPWTYEGDGGKYEPVETGKKRCRQLEVDIATFGHRDHAEPWPTEIHYRISTVLRGWFKSYAQDNTLYDCEPNGLEWRQMVEDIYLTVKNGPNITETKDERSLAAP